MSRTTTVRGLFTLTESFFMDHLQRQRGASVHTVRAYRDTLKLLFEFVAQCRGCNVAALELVHLDADMIGRFLDHIETARSNSAATRNCRRAAIRSFFRHLVRNDLSHAQQYTQVLAIPSKRARRQSAVYLEANDVRCIIAQPDRRTAGGRRDYAVLLFLYNSGARVSEAADMKWRDLHLAVPRQVRLRGKGKKERLLPLWRETADALHQLRDRSETGDHQHVFLNRHGQPLTRDGIAYILKKHIAAAACKHPALAHKRITPHVLRHSCAVALLQSGTDVTVIRDYLGHSSIATTSRYITMDLKIKREVMQSFWKHAGLERSRTQKWKPAPDVLAFLQSL